MCTILYQYRQGKILKDYFFKGKMNICYRCDGVGYEEYEEEDGHLVKNDCWHCASTGEVDDETFYHDQLCFVASCMAHDYNSASSDELVNISSEVSSDSSALAYEILLIEQLLELPKEDQDILIAWCQYRKDTMREYRDTIPHTPSFIQTIDTDSSSLNTDSDDLDA